MSREIPKRFKYVDLKSAESKSRQYCSLLLTEHTIKDKTIMEVGSGLGSLVRFLRENGAADVWAVEQDEEAAKYSIAIGNVGGDRCLAVSAQNLSHDYDKTFDMIVMSQALITPFAAWEPVIAKISQLLKPEGVFVLGYTDKMYHDDKYCTLRPTLVKYFGEIELKLHPELVLSNEYTYSCLRPKLSHIISHRSNPGMFKEKSEEKMPAARNVPGEMRQKIDSLKKKN
jgi:SAM-dependent methyltransferase